MNFLLCLPVVAKACVVAGLALLPQSVLANEPTLLGGSGISEHNNVLDIAQTNAVNDPDGLQPNTITVESGGDRGDRSVLQWSSGQSPSPLMPGDLLQSGAKNTVTISVTGNGNLFAVTQRGEFNRTHANTVGSFNQLTVTQTGFGNSAGLTQTGNGNTIVVSQNSW